MIISYKGMKKPKDHTLVSVTHSFHERLVYVLKCFVAFVIFVVQEPSINNLEKCCAA